MPLMVHHRPISPGSWNNCANALTHWLAGHADGSYSVVPPAEEVPPELPEPALGINFARDGMERKDWLCLVAVCGVLLLICLTDGL